MLAESQIEWIAGVAVAVIGALSIAYANLVSKIRTAQRERETADAQNKIKLDEMQRDFWLRHSDAIRAQVRGEVAGELANLNARINALTDAHLKCETDRIQVAADLRAALLRIADLEKQASR